MKTKEKIEIFKIDSGIFKHLVDDTLEFYNTSAVELFVYDNLIHFKYNKDVNLYSTLSQVIVYDLNSATPITYPTISDFIIGLKSLGYPINTFASGDGEASLPANYLDISGYITAVQATINTPVDGGTVVGNVSRASNLMAFCTGTFSGVNVMFEGSLEATGDSNWFGIQAVRTNANTIETATGTISAQPAYGWELSVNALKRFRVRCTARTSGTQSWIFVLGTYATEPIPASQVSATQPVSLAALPALIAGTAAIGDVGMQYRANATGAASRYHLISAASTNLANIKNAAGRLVGWSITNTNAAWRYVKLHNLATAPTAGASVFMTIGIPPNGTRELAIDAGVAFTTGIAISTVTGAADTDTTAVGANDLIIEIFFA